MVAVGRTAEDVTYRSDFNEPFQEELTDTTHLSANDICLMDFNVHWYSAIFNSLSQR